MRSERSKRDCPALWINDSSLFYVVLLVYSDGQRALLAALLFR